MRLWQTTMMCYRDRTYCPFHTTCANPCERALTKQVEKDAERANLLVSMYASEPECHTTKGKP